MIRPYLVPALLAFVALAFAGCGSPAATPDLAPAEPTPTAAPQATTAAHITLDPLAPTLEAQAVLRGQVDRPTNLTVMGSRLGGDTVSFQLTLFANGAWNTSVPLVFGRNSIEVFEPDGGFANLTALRLATATFEAVYTASPGHEPTRDLVGYDPDTLSSAPLYDGTDFERPGYFTVHDLMVAWTAQTGTPIEYSGPGAFGFGVDRIDGVGQPLSSSLPPYWCYTLNGESAELGISLQASAPGDVVTWEYGPCA